MPVSVLIKAKDGLTGRVGIMRKGVRGLERSLRGLGKVAALGGVAVGGAALVEGLRDSVEKSREFGESMGLLQTFLGGNVKRAGQLRGQIVGLSKATGKTLPDLTRGVADTVSAFGDDRNTMKRATIVAKAATAGFTETKDALALLSVVTKNYGDTSAKALGRVADLSFQVVKDGQTTFPDLANAMQTVAPNAKAAGVSMDELFAVFSTGTGVVGGADKVAVKFRAALAALTKPSAGMAKALRGLRKEGIKSGADLLRKRGFVGALRAVRGQTDGSIEAFNKLIPRVEAQGLALALTGAQGAKFARDLDHMTKAEGNLDRAVKAANGGFNTANHEMKVAAARAAALQVKIGDKLGPTIANAKLGAVEFAGALLREVSPAFAAVRSDSDGLGVSMRGTVKVVGDLVKGLLAATVVIKGVLEGGGHIAAAGASIVKSDLQAMREAVTGGGLEALQRGERRHEAITSRLGSSLGTIGSQTSATVERIGGTMLDDGERAPRMGGRQAAGEVKVRFENAPPGLRIEQVQGQGLDLVAEVGRRMVGAL